MDAKADKAAAVRLVFSFNPRARDGREAMVRCESIHGN